MNRRMRRRAHRAATAETPGNDGTAAETPILPPPSSPPGGGSPRKTLAAALLIALVVAALFLPVVDNGFTNWDDDVYVLKNPQVRVLSWTNVGGIFTSYLSGNYHPLTVLFHALEFRVFGDSARGYHAVSLLLHVANCVLLFWLVLLWNGGGLGASLAATLFFGLHPLRVETVAWVSDTKDLLNTLFLLAALIAYALHLKRQRGGFPFLALAFFAVSLLAKASGLTFPFLLLLCDYLLRRKLDRRSLAEKIPFVAAAAVAGGAALAARVDFGEMLAEAGVSWAENISTQVQRLAGYYLWRVVDMSPTRILYPILKVEATLSSATFLKALAVLALGAAAVNLSARWTRSVVFGSLFFLIALAPAFNAYMLGYSADRFTYFPFVGLAYLFGEGFGRLSDLRRPSPVVMRALSGTALAAILAVLSVATRSRIPVWKDSFTLWADAMMWYPGKGGAYAKRADAYLEAGKPEKALEDNAVMLAEQPRFWESWYVRAVALRQLGRPGEAMAAIDRAIRYHSNAAKAWLEKGRIHRMQGDSANALKSLDQAIRLDPQLPEAHLERATVLVGLGDFDAALTCLLAAERLGGEVDRDFLAKVRDLAAKQ